MTDRNVENLIQEIATSNSGKNENKLLEDNKSNDDVTTPVSSRKGRDVEELKSKFSRKTLEKMDKDGDGIISDEEMDLYIRRIKDRMKRYKYGLMLFIILFLFVILGIFVLGFELTKQFEFADNALSALGVRPLTDKDGKKLGVVLNTINVSVSEFWDEDVADESKLVTYHRGYYNNVLVTSQIARVEVSDTVATLFDYTGLVWFEYHRNGYNNTIANSSIALGVNWLMYKADLHGNVQVFASDYDTAQRRLLDSNIPSGRRLQDASTPSPTSGVGVSVP